MFQPTKHVHRLTDLSLATVKALGVRAVLLDVDNTLCSHSAKEPLPGTLEWVAALEKEGFGVYIVSNNFRDRVQKVAQKFSLPFVSFSLKPLPYGFRKAQKALGLHGPECLVVGDQIFTDILGANLCRMKSVLVDPVEDEVGLTFAVRRFLERPIKRKLSRKDDHT